MLEQSIWRLPIIVLAIVGAAAILWRGYTWLAPEPADVLPIDLLVHGGEPDLVTSLATHLNAPVTTGNRVEALQNGVEIFPAMLQAIEEAEQTVHFLTYVYWTGEIAERFASTLVAAARRGVVVRVVLDAFGANPMDDALVESMEAAGVQVAWFHPVDWYNLRRVNHRTHRKVLVVDGRIGFTGGVGIAEEWTGNAQDPSHWRDSHFRLTGPVVRWLQGAFVENWRNATGEVLTGSDVFPTLADSGEARILSLTTAPRGNRAPIAFLYWTALRHAESTVDIATPYFVPDVALGDEIIRAARRGVRIRLLVPNDHNDSRLVRMASLSYYPDLLDAGVEIYEFQPTMLHTKTLTVDGRWSVIGSANFDNRSFELNDEITMLVDDRVLNRTLKTAFEHDLTRSRKVNGQVLDQIPWWKQIAVHAALTLREQL